MKLQDILSNKDLETISQFKTDLLVSKANAKRAELIKSKIQLANQETVNDPRCFCGGKFEQEKYLKEFLSYIKNIEEQTDDTKSDTE